MPGPLAGLGNREVSGGGAAVGLELDVGHAVLSLMVERAL